MLDSQPLSQPDDLGARKNVSIARVSYRYMDASGSGAENDFDPLAGAGRDFAEHERELLEDLMTRVQRDISKGATVGEAIAEMRRAMTEDDDAREMLTRVAIIQSQNRGYISSYFEELNVVAADPEARYTSAIGGRPLTREELDLMKRLGDELDRRLPPDLSEEEREARGVELLEEDEELAGLASQLERLAARRGGLPRHDDPAAGDP